MVGVSRGPVVRLPRGLDLEKVLEWVRRAQPEALRCRTLHRGIIRRDFAPRLFVEHFIKDMGIALREAQAPGIGQYPV